jgi:Phosphotransferase enzyme family
MLTADGRMGGATVVGDTVRKPVGPWTPAVHALLNHLENVGFDGAPRVLGIDDSGREVLTYLLSDARSRIDAPKSDEALVALGRLLRDFRESVNGFEPPPHASWRLGKTLRGGQIICHNDVNPGNVVYRDGKPYALIDWDLAGPGSTLDDFVRAAILFTPLVPDEICRVWGFDEAPYRPHRLGCLCAGYGVESGAWILDAVETLERRDLDDLLTLGRQGVSPFASFLSSGSEEATRRDLSWLAAERDHLERALS